MKLLTEAQRTKLLANGTRRGPDHKPVVKWFNAGGAGTCMLSELDPEYPDECGFGLADLGFGTPELGSKAYPSGSGRINGWWPRCYARSGATRLWPRESALSRPTTRSPADNCVTPSYCVTGCRGISL